MQRCQAWQTQNYLGRVPRKPADFGVVERGRLEFQIARFQVGDIFSLILNEAVGPDENKRIRHVSLTRAWVPLQDTPFDMGPLAFAPRSHRFEHGRDLEISDESEAAVGAALEAQGFGQFEEPFRLGEVSFHSGWTFHRAGPNRTDRCREVMTVIYMDVDMRLSAPRNKNQVVDRETWCPGAVVGERIETPLNPVLYESVRSRSDLR